MVDSKENYKFDLGVEGLTTPNQLPLTYHILDNNNMFTCKRNNKSPTQTS